MVHWYRSASALARDDGASQFRGMPEHTDADRGSKRRGRYVGMDEWSEQGLGASVSLDAEQTALWLDAYNAEPERTNYTAHGMLIFLAAKPFVVAAFGPIERGGNVVVMFDESDCATGRGRVQADVAKRVWQAAFGSPA